MTPQDQFDTFGYAVIASPWELKIGDAVEARVYSEHGETFKVLVKERTTRREFESVTDGVRPAAGYAYYRVVAE